ncbi:MAG: LytTR family DNA-binding domain-containing protein [Oscillospiraceae bacterium]
MYRVAICDDDMEVCKFISNVIQKYNSDICCKYFTDGITFWNNLNFEEQYDLIFMDIELDIYKGTNIIKKIRNELQNEIIQVVYISSKQGYAMELFETRPLNFLVKPLSGERIIESLEYAIKLYEEENNWFVFTYGKYVSRIEYKNIQYFESKGKKIYIITNDETYEFYGKLSDILKDAPTNDFTFIHKSFLINNLYVTKYEYEKVTMANGVVLPISQNYRKDIRNRLITQRKGSVKI